MPTPTNSPGNPDDPAQKSDEFDQKRNELDQTLNPIDPTLTFDSYYEKQTESLTKPTEAIPAADASSSEEDAFSSEEAESPEETGSETAYSEPGPADSEIPYSEPSYTGPSAYSTSEFSEPTDREPSYEPRPIETVAPARFSAPTATAAPTVTAPGPTIEAEPAPRVMRMRTVVFGLVLLVIAGAVLVGQLTDVTVDAGGVLLALMIGGGVLLIAGARRS